MRGRRLISVLAMSTATALLIGCSGGGGSSGGGSVGTTPPPPPPPPPPPSSGTISPTSFTDTAVQRGLVFTSGYTNDVNEMVRLFAGGGAAGDVDGDGDLDVVIVPGNLGPNLLYLNDGSGSFREAAADAGIDYTDGALTNHRLSGPVLGDLDGDGDLDLFMGGLAGDPSLVFENDGTGVFTDVTAASGLMNLTSVNTVSAALGDYDGDGDLDLGLAHWGTPRDPNTPEETETLLRNDSDINGIRFTPVSLAAGISDGIAIIPNGALSGDFDYTFAPSFADIDNDGDQDFLSVSDFGGSRVFLNRGDGTFENVTDTRIINDTNGMGSAVGDMDNDGDLDWFVSSIDGNRLYENLGDGSFARPDGAADVELGGWGWGSCFADFNADGHLDIYQTNGWNVGRENEGAAYALDESRLWMSDGTGQYVDMAVDFGMQDQEQGRGVICDDFDGDGDVDAMLISLDAQQAAMLWENQLDSPNTLIVTLEGSGANTQAIGSRIDVTVGGVQQTRWVTINSNFISHNSTQQVFGLGTQTSIDRVLITWPDGTTTEPQNVSPGDRLTVSQAD